jgi:hypothetical protein
MWHVAELDALHVKRIHLVGCFHIVTHGEFACKWTAVAAMYTKLAR